MMVGRGSCALDLSQKDKEGTGPLPDGLETDLALSALERDSIARSWVLTEVKMDILVMSFIVFQAGGSELRLMQDF